MLACARHTLTFSRNIIVLPRPLGSINFLSSKIQLECLGLFSVRFHEFQFFNLVSSNKLFFASYMSRTRLCFSQREFCSLLMQLGNKQRNMFHPHVCAAAQRRCVFERRKMIDTCGEIKSGNSAGIDLFRVDHLTLIRLSR